MIPKHTSLITLAVLLASVHVMGQDLNVVVPAISGYSNSRPAHFNWSFQSSGGGAVRMGQFACGSWWVAPAEGDTGVTVLSLEGKTDDPNWHDFVSCDADPITESMGLLDGSNGYGNYNPDENIIPDLPLTFTPVSSSCISLVAAMKRNEAETSKAGTRQILGEVVDAYCVVTVMPDAPANNGSDMIRPNITGSTKQFLTWDDFDLNRIPSHNFIAGRTPADWEKTAIRWRHSTEIFGIETEHDRWRSVIYSEGGQAFRAYNLIISYGASVAAAFNGDLLALLSSQTDIESVKPAIAAMCSYGLDIYHARFDYGDNRRKTYSSGAGQELGRFLPSVFLASLLKDGAMADVLRRVAIDNQKGEDYFELGPQELRQQMRGVTGVVLWGDYQPFLRSGNNLGEGDWRYWAGLMDTDCFDTSVVPCFYANSGRAEADPYRYIDGPPYSPAGIYCSVAFGPTRSFAACMILMPAIRDVVNTDHPIEYVDRAIRHGAWTSPDPLAVPTPEDQTNGCKTFWAAEGCTDWGVLWGPVPSDIRFAIEDGTGRFKSRNGNAIGFGGYETGLASGNWSSIISLYSGDRYEDRAVPLGTLVSPDIFFENGPEPKAHLMTPNFDAVIHYTLDGTDPDESSPLYTGPVPISDGMDVRAKAFPLEMSAEVQLLTLYPDKLPSAVSQKTFTAPWPGDHQSPAAPGGLALESGSPGQASLSWDPVTDNSGIIRQYNVYLDGAPVHAGIQLTSLITGLGNGSSHQLAVSATDYFGNESPLSAPLEIQVDDAGTVSVVTPPPFIWRGFLRGEDGFMETGLPFGRIYAGLFPWMRSDDFGRWFFATENEEATAGCWIYLPQ